MPASPEKRWTEEQDSTLREGWAGGVSAEDLALKLLRTETSIRGRVAILGVRRSPGYISSIRSSLSVGKRFSWTEEEENMLRVFYEEQGLSYEEVAVKLPVAKTYTAIRMKVRKLGLHHTKEQFLAVCSRMSMGDRNGMYGKPGINLGKSPSEETRNKIRENKLEGFASGRLHGMVGPLNPAFGKPSSMRGKHLPDSAKQTLSQKARVRWLDRSEQYKSDHLLKMRKGWITWAMRTEENRTWIEKLVAIWLQEEALAFTEQTQVGFYIVDFLVGNKVIETQGDYWHANPSVYSQLDSTQKSNVRRDKAKATYLKNRGFGFLSLWELDLKKNPEGCRNLLREFLAS